MSHATTTGGAPPPSVTLTIDEKLVSARQGESLLHVIQQQGGHVPTLCEFEGLSSVSIVPRLTARVAPLHHVVHVDEYIPGCPPDADRIWAALLALVHGEHVRADDAPAPKFGG